MRIVIIHTFAFISPGPVSRNLREGKTIRISLLKEAVRKLEGTRINKRSSESACNNAKRRKVSDIYVLQHNTIQEVILLSYGQDSDVLSLCDARFLFNYIRPKDYELSPSDNMVYLFTDSKLIAKKLISLLSTEALFTNIKQKEQDISPIHIKEFLDGLLDEGKRSSVVSQFKEFFEAVLFKYGSIAIILQLCRPLTGNISNPNIKQVDDILLTGKLSAYLESSFEEESYMEKTDIRENGAYFVHKDYDYLEMKNINDITKFIGVKVNVDKFVRTMFDTLVTDTARIEDIFADRRFD
ncbi:Hypothetical predicted protein [Mytilus galloprovincialis]|uniref:Uncharacterized protein n=1 Tax=Mytilus galloprovincialis TaxID=29158 RepID=A0A8B6HAN2_MYTGA|nr:Hypothetical predicted protein [Mytilus galloprovincialis]